MDETANEIEAHIDRTRERLGSNLKELEDKVDAATDWREHFRERPHLFLGIVFAGGVLVATVSDPSIGRGTGQMAGSDAPQAVPAQCPRRRWISGITSRMKQPTK